MIMYPQMEAENRNELEVTGKLNKTLPYVLICFSFMCPSKNSPFLVSFFMCPSKDSPFLVRFIYLYKNGSFVTSWCVTFALHLNGKAQFNDTFSFYLLRNLLTAWVHTKNSNKLNSNK